METTDKPQIQCQEIQKTNEQYRRIIEALSEFVFIFDKDFVIQDVIMASSAVLLHPKEELIGINGRLIYSPEVSDLYISTIRACLEDQKQKEIEYPLEADGQTYYFQARIAPYEENRVLALIRDVTDRVTGYNKLITAKQKAEEADKMKTLFMSNMSHEIRTPLNAIIGFSDVLAVTEDPEERSIYQDIVQKNTKLLLQLVESMLELSRMDSGNTDWKFEQCLLNDLVQDSELLLGMSIPSGVVLKYDIPEEIIMQNTDKYWLKQIVSNFLTNAIENTTKGSITLKLEATDEWVKIAVTDTGCGIPKENLSSIFNRFEKLDDFKQGVGLGLSLCQSIAKNLNGRIDAESEVGVGSTFSILLRRDGVNRSNRTPNAKKRILLAEESDTVAKEIIASLGEEHEVIRCHNGVEAENYLQYENPDLLIVDMSFVDAQTSVELIVKARTQLIPIPILATTNQMQYSEQQRARHAGANCVMSKPFAEELLRENVTLLLRS